jgi:hypothetical protein
MSHQESDARKLRCFSTTDHEGRNDTCNVFGLVVRAIARPVQYEIRMTIAGSRSAYVRAVRTCARILACAV